MTAPPRLSVRQILHPRSVAVFGASDDTSKFGGRILHYLTRHGFSGDIVPVNPSRREIKGLPCFSSIGAAGRTVDVAILAIPSGSILPSVEACAAAGVGACVIVSTGFAEADATGAAVQARLVSLCRETGMRIIGPNCMGLINPHHALALTSSLVLEVEVMRRGPIGLISQSGALMVSIFDRAHDAGIGFSSCVSLGNQSDIEICDILEFMIDDPATSAICMYIEGLRDGLRFRALAEVAQAAGKPVLAVKTGRTEAGVRAARSHTASLAGSYAVFEAICRERGVVLMDDVDAMVFAAKALARFGPARPGGIGVFSPSGGGAGIGVDRVASAGMRLANLSEATRETLRSSLLPPQADNPIDLGGRLRPDEPGTAGAIAAAFAADADVGAILVMMTTTPRYEATASEIGAALLASGKPFVVAVMPGGAADGVRAALREIGCPFVDRVDEAVRVLQAYTEHGHLSERPYERPPPPSDLPPRSDLERFLSGSAPREPEVKALVAGYGAPIARERFCAEAGEAAVVAEAIGFPVALKAVCSDLVHKSDVGAVRLHLRDAAAVQRAWREIDGALRQHLPEARLEGCLVSEMVEAAVELIVGLKSDDQFGPMVLVGFGGVAVELAPDLALASAPVSPERARHMLTSLRQYPLLDGFRGRRKADIEAIADLVSRMSFLGDAAGSELAALDLNPVLVRSKDGLPVVVDARAILPGRHGRA